jgi:hypothetical protein
MNAKKLFVGTSVALALAAAAATPASALTVILHPIYPGTVSGSVPYSSNEQVIFKFTVKSPYNFDFSATGTGGNFPFAISDTATGSAGTYTETFGKYPVHGTLSYSLTTVPEPASWALMLVGFGAAGVSIRRKMRAQAAA